MKTKFAIAVSVGLAALCLAQDDGLNIREGQRVVYSMVGTNGRKFTNASLTGKVVLIDFWATWCGPCKAASPTIQKLHEKYAKSGLVAIGANVWERNDKMGAAAKYAKEHKYTYAFSVNNDGLTKAWGVSSIPTFVIIDKRGVVRAIQVGFSPSATPAQLEATVKRLLQ
jgi:thiol-disulfide isomerase/thioredoxin